MQRYKALMLDLDGTTIPNSPDAMPSQKVIEAIAKAQKRLHVCAVTSRPLAFAVPILEALNLTSLCIVDGGAQIYDPTSKKIIWEQPIDPEDVKLLWEFVDKNKLTFYYSDGSLKKLPTRKKETIKVFDVLIRKLTNEQADKLIKELSHIPTISYHKTVSWDIGNIDVKISHVKATKQHGIVTVTKKLGINPTETIGVGEGYNDYPLLMACGLKVAMGNAVEELKAIADFIAPSVEEDGVVAVIEKFVLQ
jgi:HAD superfamily hydrolase (TIGR01484 family)